MGKTFSQNFAKYHGCGVSFMDGTLLLDEKHCGVHHKKCFFPATQPFWKRPEDVINKVKTRSQLQKKKYFLKISKTNISSMQEQKELKIDLY